VPDLKIINTSQLTSNEGVQQISRAKRGEIDKSGELCFATSKGLFFGRYDKFCSFAENKEESYFNGCDVTSFFEYEVDKFVCAICNDPENNYIQIIDRTKKGKITKVKNPAAHSVVL